VATPASAGTADVWDGTADTSWYISDAPQGTIFEIHTAEELAGLAQLVKANTSFWNKTIKLCADIDLDNRHWTPIGGQTNSHEANFIGEFNGNGHTISNLYINGNNLTGGKLAGLFGRVGHGGADSVRKGSYIHDFTIKKAKIENPKAGTGVVVGNTFHDNVLENITVEDVIINGRGSAIAGGANTSQFKNIIARNVTITAVGGEIGGMFSQIQSYTYPVSGYARASFFTAKNDSDPTKTIQNYCLPGTLMSDSTPENLTNNPVFVCYFENVHGYNITMNVSGTNSYVGGFTAYNLDYNGDSMFTKNCSLTDLKINVTSGSPSVGGFVALNATMTEYEYDDTDGVHHSIKGFDSCSVQGEINGLGGTYGGFVAEATYYGYGGRGGFNPAQNRTFLNTSTDVKITASAGATVGGFAAYVNTNNALSGTNKPAVQSFIGCEVLGTTKLGDADPIGSNFIGECVTNSTKGIVIVNCTVSGIEDIDEYLARELLIDSTATREDVLKKILLGNGAASANFTASSVIVFDTDGGTAIPSVEGTLGTAVTVPANPTKDGYTFIGWNKEIPTIIPGSVITVKALWEINDYTITFDTDGGSAIAPITQAFGSSVTAPADPTKDGYTFKGWDKEIPTTMPIDGLTVKALWEANDYTITFDTDGGSAIAPITQAFGSSITAPSNPTKDGYTFKGWDKEIPTTMPIDGLTVKALWEVNDYTITFDTDGGSAITPITQAFGSSITAPADPTKEGYTFKGWDKEIPSTMPIDGLTVKALWEANDYTITFDTDGGSAIAPITQAFGSSITAPTDPTRDGYTFKGWDKEIPTTMPIDGLTVNALWEVNSYTITFNANGGSNVAPITQDFGTAVTQPADPALEDYIFDGWYADEELTQAYTFTTMPAGDITIYAKWKPVPVKVPITGDNAYPLLWIIGVALSIIAIAVILFTSKKKCVR